MRSIYKALTLASSSPSSNSSLLPPEAPNAPADPGPSCDRDTARVSQSYSMPHDAYTTMLACSHARRLHADKHLEEQLPSTCDRDAVRAGLAPSPPSSLARRDATLKRGRRAMMAGTSVCEQPINMT